MKRAGSQHEVKGSLELIEEATHLLRTAPMATLASYYLGALPFVLAFLYFWGDMARSPFAYLHLAGATMGLAALFLWMKFWQAIFARSLRGAVSGEPAPLTVRQCGRIFLTQSALQPTGLFLLPIALLPAALPFPWVYAFYQNLTVQADGESSELKPALKQAMRQAAFWPAQTYLLLLLFMTFGLCVFVNWGTVGFFLPLATKTLFGLESVFTRSGTSLLNTTFFAAMVGLTYLCVDPIMKAVYVLRCFYGESVSSGEDLKAELRQFSVAQVSVCVLALLLSAGAWQSTSLSAELTGSSGSISPGRIADSVPATESKTMAGASAVSPSELERVIEEVSRQRKYTWRAPREKIIEPVNASDGILTRFLQRVKNFVWDGLKAIGNWLGNWLRRLLWRSRPFNYNSSGYSWMMLLEILLYALIAAVVLGLGFLLYRVWRNRYREPGPLLGEPIQPAPDLLDENLGADQLPEDGWSKLAQELLARGELRLAMRAFYLGSLAHLAGRNLISLAKFKSNRDYECELARRGHSWPELLSLFGENVSAFDRVWYGLHEINTELVTRFASNVERIKTGGGTV